MQSTSWLHPTLPPVLPGNNIYTALISTVCWRRQAPQAATSCLLSRSFLCLFRFHLCTSVLCLCPNACITFTVRPHLPATGSLSDVSAAVGCDSPSPLCELMTAPKLQPIGMKQPRSEANRGPITGHRFTFQETVDFISRRRRRGRRQIALCKSLTARVLTRSSEKSQNNKVAQIHQSGLQRAGHEKLPHWERNSQAITEKGIQIHHAPPPASSHRDRLTPPSSATLLGRRLKMKIFKKSTVSCISWGNSEETLFQT